MFLFFPLVTQYYCPNYSTHRLMKCCFTFPVPFSKILLAQTLFCSVFVSSRLPRRRQRRGIRGQVFGAESQCDDRNHRHCAFSGCFWLFLVASGCFWLFLVVSGCCFIPPKSSFILRCVGLFVPGRVVLSVTHTFACFSCSFASCCVPSCSSGRSLPPHTQG